MRLRIFILIGLCTACARREEPVDYELDLYFRSYFVAGEPGGAVLVMKSDSIIFSQGYGLADMQTEEPITPHTLFNLGSISKTFVANAILILQERGRLSVEDSIIQYFPEFKNRRIGQQVKIRHLLTHTSGLPDNRHVALDTLFYLTAKDSANWHPETQVDSLLFEPGTRYQYSNPAFNGLALIVEKVSGMPWQQFVRENIFIPAGMENSTITDGSYPERGVSHAYIKNYKHWLEDDYGEEPTFAAAGNGGVWSSVEELALYEKALRQATFLNASSIRDSRTVKQFANWQGAQKPFIGWSWFVTDEDSLHREGHSGSQGGFLTNYVTLPADDILFVILCNTPREDYAMRKTTNDVLTILRKHRLL